VTRVISGAVLAAAALGAILYLPITALRVVTCGIAALAAHEYVRVAGAGGGISQWLIVVATVALCWLTSGGLPVGALTLLLVAVHRLLDWRATLLLIGTVVVSDSMQYFTGRMLGRHPLAPAISPKKTIEGAIGGVIFGTAFLTIVGSLVLPFSGYASLIILGLLVVILGICGDLFESRLKRTAGMKDSSALIPGHGGVLDRIDALLFAVAPFYLYIRNVT
jgi:CDP-diglyceride synthetase